MMFAHPGVAVVVLLLALALALLFARHRRRGDGQSLLLRFVAFLAALFALSGPQAASRIDHEEVYFIVDRSASLGLAEEYMLEQLHRLGHSREGTQYGVIAFGTQPMIEVSPTSVLSLTAFQTSPEPDDSDIAAAVGLALESLPREGAGTLVLLSDGNATEGELDAVLSLARRRQIPVHVRPVAPPSAEFWLEEFDMPAEIAVNIPFPLRLKYSATAPGRGTLLLYRDDKLVLAQEVELRPGVNRLELCTREIADFCKIAQPGVYVFRAQLRVPGDGIAGNNKLDAVARARDGPPVLVLDRGQANRELVPQGITRAGIRAQHQTLSEFPLNLAALSAYQVVMLNNIEIRSLEPHQIQALRSYVRDLGRGLVVIHGQQAVTGLTETDFDQLLPVTYEGTQIGQLPALALLLLLDKSSSMNEYVGRVAKIEVLKETAAASVEILEPKDMLGVLAFDRDYQWLVPFQEAGNKQEIYRHIKELSAGGGTDMYDALREAFQTMQRVRARLRHIIVFSDGKTQRKGRDYEALFAEIRRSGVTVSAIAIDRQPDQEMMGAIAEAGRGKLYIVEDFADLPQISLREIQRVARNRWVAGELAVEAGPFAGKLPPDVRSAPPLQGYAVTFPKRTAELAWTAGAADDPLVAFWRYGLGRSAVLNTDLEGLGSRSWLEWPQLGSLLGAILGQVYQLRAESQALALQLLPHGKGGRAVVEAQAAGRWLNLLSLQGQLLPAQRPEPLEAIPLQFMQVAAGRYEADVEELPEGVYLLEVRGRPSDSADELTAQRAFSWPYSRELKRIGVNELALERIAAATNGRYLEDDMPLPTAADRGLRGYVDLAPGSLLFALLLFVVDLILRKLPWPTRTGA